jgi:4-hydroxy-tetrahydrodipicolinate synthase
MRRPEVKGVYAAIVTHFDAELNVDHDAVAAEVTRLIDAGVHGILPNGTVGEGGSLTREERRAVIETAVGAAGGQAPVCVGVSAATAEQATGYARDARSAGADSVMSLPPLLYRADRRELIEFFGTVAREADLPLMIYNNPQSSGSDLEPELLAELVREVPGIAALKETSGDARRIAQLVNLCPDVDVLVTTGRSRDSAPVPRAGSRVWSTCSPLRRSACGTSARPAIWAPRAACTPPCCRSPAST